MLEICQLHSSECFEYYQIVTKAGSALSFSLLKS